MKMVISKEAYRKFKTSTENKLRSYPYYLIAVEMPGLGGATRYDQIKDKSNSFNSIVENSVIDDEYKDGIINMINYIYDRLDAGSKRIIETAYFRDDITRDEVISELHIDDNCYYRKRKKALEKFIIGLGYLN